MTSIVAALGPTNTGKTHRAIERMLEHESGMIGLPLRLLAREVYDRVSATLGEERVALITGEEKRVPRSPDYWVCTVEAMPMDRSVDFVAIDEVQLAAHRERGHVFTDRLLNARGRLETWFLGSDTMRPLVTELVPTAAQHRFHRLSRLRYAGRRSLRSLSPRSAVVAFSTDQVYDIAERLRHLKGGVAVVLGALSPRTRNAQVAMYQSGEVQYLVATDAIGMGLNLDVDHIAFAALRKFDGREQRPLTNPELAQIAGRAGRHLNDGTFGTLRPLPELSPQTALALEGHRFRPLRRLVWRSSDLEFESIDSLVTSLVKPPTHPALQRVEAADDFHALKELARDDEVVRAATTPEAVELLWEVCQIPDFRKLLLHRHVMLLRTVFLQLMTLEGLVDEGWLEAQVKRVDDLTGGIDALTARLAAVRTWTYLSQRGRWLRDPGRWQERTRGIEDALGDALHERLVERFVEQAGRSRGRKRVDPTKPPPGATGPFAALAKLAPDLSLDDAEDTIERFVARVSDAEHDAFDVDRRGRIFFEGERIARLVRGKELREPMAALDDPDSYSAGERQRLERRLVALGRDVVHEATGGLSIPTGDAGLRGLRYVLEQGLGIAAWREVSSRWEALGEETQNQLKEAGLRRGIRYVFVDAALSPTALERRATLVGLHRDVDIARELPGDPVVEPRRFPSRAAVVELGYAMAGPAALRVDVLEELLSELDSAVSGGPRPPILDALDIAPKTIAALGYREVDGQLVRRKRRRRAPKS